MKKSYAIGVDFGGTNTKVGLVSRAGRVLAYRSFPTGRGGKRRYAQRLKTQVDFLLAEARVSARAVAGVGVGLPGLVDSKRGFIHTLVNVPGWDNTPARGLLGRALRMPVFLDNDVNVVTLGEIQFGAAKGCRDVVCVTLGTGVGGGVYLNGALHHGASLTAGEIGHIIVQRKGPRCNCGNRGCLEALLGAKGLMAQARKALGDAKSGKLARWVRGGARLTPKLLQDAAYQGDKIAIGVWRDSAEHLGLVFAGLTNLLNPEIFVVGGGIAKVGRIFLREVRRVLKAHAMKVPGRAVRVVASDLGSHAGVLGAASLVWRGGNR